MKVAFDSRPLADPNGIGRYCRGLLDALRDTAHPGDEIVPAHRPSAMARGAMGDVLHSPWMDGAMLHCPVPTVVTLHNLSAFKRRSEHLRGLRLRLRHLAVQRAAKVIVPTEAVAQDAVTHLRLDRDRVVVIPEAADAAMYPRTQEEVAGVRARYALPDTYLVCVGDLQHPEPGRQLAKLAAADRKMALVCVGPTSAWAHELPNVVLTGQVSDDELAAIHTGAHAVMLPSADEGFGLAAVEALACGAPVVTCDVPSLREALAERATFVAPGDVSALLNSAESMTRPAPPPPSWTWGDAARATWSVYSGAVRPLEQPRRAPRGLRTRRAVPRRLDGIGPQ